MPKALTEKLKYRQRGYVCPGCDVKTLTFGEGDAPKVCEGCGEKVTMLLEWDHIVETTTIVSQYAPN